jgi:hypothetical protein
MPFQNLNSEADCGGMIPQRSVEKAEDRRSIVAIKNDPAWENAMALAGVQPLRALQSAHPGLTKRLRMQA